MDIANALIEALLQRGIRRVYGVPGDYVLGLFDRFEQSPIEMVCTAGEEGAGFAADAHARLHGLGVAVVTYGVGALKLLNPVAGAYAERSPVLVISGAPGVRESDGHALLHHSIRASDTQQRFFHEVCAETPGSIPVAPPPVKSPRCLRRCNGSRAPAISNCRATA